MGEAVAGHGRVNTFHSVRDGVGDRHAPFMATVVVCSGSLLRSVAHPVRVRFSYGPKTGDRRQGRKGRRDDCDLLSRETLQFSDPVSELGDLVAFESP